MITWFKSRTIDWLIVFSTTLFILAEIVINFITSYGHISILGLMYGEDGTDAALTPVGIDLALFVFAEINLFLARKGRYVTKKNGKRRREFRWPSWVLAFGVSATLAANLAYGFHWGWTGAAIAGFSAVFLFFTVEGGMLLLRVVAEEREKATPAAFPALREPTDAELAELVAQHQARTLAAVQAPTVAPADFRPTPQLNLDTWAGVNATQGLSGYSQ